MLGAPISVWGHTIFPYLPVHDILTLHCVNKHLRAGTSPALTTYTHWLLCEIQVLTYPAVLSFRQQIPAISSQAKAELQPISQGHIAEVMAFSRPHRYMLAVAEIAVLLYRGPQGDYWRFFTINRFEIFRWLWNLDPLTPSLVLHLPAIEVFLSTYTEQELGKVWAVGAYFYKFLQEIVKFGRIRSKGDVDEMEMRLRRCEGELRAVERLEGMFSR